MTASHPPADTRLVATARDGAWRDALLDALRDGFFVLDEDATVIEVNESFSSVLGYTAEHLPIPVPHPWWPDPAADPEQYARVAAALEAAANNAKVRFQVRLRHRDGHGVWVECSIGTVRDPEGNRRRTVGLVRDITAERLSARRDRLQAEIGRLLAQPGDLGLRLNACAECAAEAFGAPVVLLRTTPDGRIGPVSAAYPGRPELAREMLELGPARIPGALLGPYLAGRPFVLDPVPGEVLFEVLGNAGQAAGLRGLGIRGTLVAPLAVSGRVLGGFVVLKMDSRRRFEPSDMELAEEVARQLAGVIEPDRVATRERQLHEAAAALAGATTVGEAAEALATAVSGALGAAGVVVFTVHDDDQRHVYLEHHHGFPAGLAERFRVSKLSDPSLTSVVILDRRPLWMPDEASWRGRFPHLSRLEGAAEAKAWLALPLRLGERALGAVIACFNTEREFPPEERGFALTLVTQAAQAFERAAVTDAHWEIARTLQRSLLPSRLPAGERLALAAHYQPAGQHNQAGGDWYDVVELPGGRVGVVVGDVVGHGAAAAAIMGQLRAALTGFLLEGHGPGQALRLLSRLAARVDGALASTAVCLLIDPEVGELRWSSAGHPAPLRFAPDGVRLLDDARGPVLGVADVAYPEARVRLPTGAGVLLYTDGLIESRVEGPKAGVTRLTEVVAGLPGAEPAALLRAVLADALDHTTPDDDVALVVAQVLPVPSPSQPSEPGPNPEPATALVDLEPRRELRVEEHPDGSRTLWLAGELDLAVIEPVRALVLQAVSGCTGQVTIDTRHVTYLGSSGVRLIAEAIQAANGRLRLAVQPGTVAEAHLSVCGFEGAGLSFQPPSRGRVPRPID